MKQAKKKKSDFDKKNELKRPREEMEKNVSK